MTRTLMGNDTIIISGDIANFDKVSDEAFLDFLREKDPDLSIYKMHFESRTDVAAAFDWKALARKVGFAASLITIVNFRWEFYDKKIKPQG